MNHETSSPKTAQKRQREFEIYSIFTERQNVSSGSK